MEDSKTKERITNVLPHLNEKLRRLYLVAKAKSYGWGGKSKIAELSGESRFLVSRGVNELDNPELQSDIDSVRHFGGGKEKSDRQTRVLSICHITNCKSSYIWRPD